MIALDAMPIDKWSDEDLAGMLRDRDDELARLGGERKAIMAELGRRFGDVIKAAYAKAEKSHGKLKIRPVAEDAAAVAFGGVKADDGASFDLEVEIRQSVDWDTSKLIAASSNDELMTPEQAQHLFKVEMSVPEKTYNALPPGPLKQALTDARTTKLSAPTIKVVFPDN